MSGRHPTAADTCSFVDAASRCGSRPRRAHRPGRARSWRVPLVVVLAAGRRAKRARRARWQISRQVSAERLFEGERVTVTVTLRTREPLALVELLQPLPPHVWAARGSHHAFFSLGADEEVCWTFELACAGRQQLRLADLHLRLWEPLGLAAAETRHQEPRAEVARLPARHPVPAPAPPRRTQAFVGNHVSPRAGRRPRARAIFARSRRATGPPRELARHAPPRRPARDTAPPGAERRRRPHARHAGRPRAGGELDPRSRRSRSGVRSPPPTSPGRTASG